MSTVIEAEGPAPQASSRPTYNGSLAAGRDRQKAAMVINGVSVIDLAAIMGSGVNDSDLIGPVFDALSPTVTYHHCTCSVPRA